MRRSARRTLMALALAASGAASELAVCSLPASALYIQEGSALVPCGSSTLSVKCQTACSCRRLESDKNVYGVCINSSTTFDCDATLNATSCSQGTGYCTTLSCLAVYSPASCAVQLRHI